MEDEKVKELLRETSVANTQEEAKEAWDDLQGYLWADYLPATKIGNYNKVHASTSAVEGFTLFDGSPIFWNTSVNE